jgi:hypothetical protein
LFWILHNLLDSSWLKSRFRNSRKLTNCASTRFRDQKCQNWKEFKLTWKNIHEMALNSFEISNFYSGSMTAIEFCEF